ncbi:hypothetical protein KKB44_05530 [Candidatus Micrarchaeota archaeon]|nr:hypothetical protein [Candidatus Micrarchaeota archaeon]
MKRFEGFRLNTETADLIRANHTYNNPKFQLMCGFPAKPLKMRTPLVEEVYERAMAGESLRITGYPGAGKTELIIHMLTKTYEDDLLGLGIILYPNLGGFHIHSDQLLTAWKLIDEGFKPRFLVIDEASEAVPKLRKLLNGKFIPDPTLNLGILLDILAKLPDSTSLVVSFPSIKKHLAGSDKTREQEADFFGPGATITIPSYLTLEDFANLFYFKITSYFGSEQKAGVNKLADKLAEHIGLYDGAISTLLLRQMFDHRRALKQLIDDGDVEHFCQALHEAGLLTRFASDVIAGVSLPLEYIQFALSAFDNKTLSEDSDLQHLVEYGILLNGANINRTSLTFNAFQCALSS